MEGTAIANAQTQGSDLCAIDVDARRIGFGRSLDTIAGEQVDQAVLDTIDQFPHTEAQSPHVEQQIADQDRKSTRLNSSHVKISYAVFCLKKKKKQKTIRTH